MRETLIVSGRGQITLPAAVVEIDTYSDAQIVDWDREDVLTADERQRILARLQAA